MGPARMFAESLTPSPGIREQYRHETNINPVMVDVRHRAVKPKCGSGAVRPPIGTRELSARSFLAE